MPGLFRLKLRELLLGREIDYDDVVFIDAEAIVKWTLHELVAQAAVG